MPRLPPTDGPARDLGRPQDLEVGDPEVAALEADEKFLAALRRIAEQAGHLILAYRNPTKILEVREKFDASPVTDADEAAETLILSALEELTPDIPVVSEEASAAGRFPDISGGLFWLVDPLDGTKEFISESGEFTVNIALIRGGAPVAGVVHAPAMGMTWVGAGAGTATLTETGQSPKPITARRIPNAGAVVVASRRHGDQDRLGRYLADYKVAKRLEAGSSVKFCLVASGKADLYPRFGRTMEWDTAAGHAVLRAAGGTLCRADNGAPLVYGKPGFENPDFIARGRV